MCILPSGMQFLPGDPRQNAIGLVLSCNWADFVVKTWQPWAGLFGHFACLRLLQFISNRCELYLYMPPQFISMPSFTPRVFNASNSSTTEKRERVAEVTAAVM